MKSFASRARPVLALVVTAVLCTAAFAGDDPLELTLGGSYSDTEGIGQAAAITGEGLAKLGHGVAGPAIEFRYSDPDGGRSSTGTAFGAVYELGIGSWKLQPFIGARGLYWTGDVDAEYQVGARAGIKTGGGDSAFLKVFLERARAFGARDVDSTDLTVAIGYRF